MAKQPQLIRAVVFDWAGTTVDHGSIAPTVAFRNIFADHGITVTEEQIRAPMGMGKRDHIASMTRMPEIRTAWLERHGAEPSEADIDQLYLGYGDIIDDAIAAHSELIPEVVPAVRQLQERGIAIGSTTGYVRSMMVPVLERAAADGYSPAATVCSDEVPAGRPAPWMLFEVMRQLDVYPTRAVVKVGDTVQDIEEALNAGAWAVGVARTGNLIGLSLQEWQVLSTADQEARLQHARTTLLAAGAHHVIDTLAELPGLIGRIERGESSGRSWSGQRALQGSGCELIKQISDPGGQPQP